MGWNSYDYYDTTVTEADVKANADYMAEYLKPHGYEYIVIDIQWSDPQAGNRRDELLTNEEVLYLLTDTHGAEQIKRDNEHTVWLSKDNHDNSNYLALFNLSHESSPISVSLDEPKIGSRVFIRDLWEHKDLVPVVKWIQADIPPYGAALYRLDKIKQNS